MNKTIVGPHPSKYDSDAPLRPEVDLPADTPRLSENSPASPASPASVGAGASSAPFLYADGLDHIADELVFVRALLRRYLGVQGTLKSSPQSGGALSGMAVGADEVVQFLEGAAAEPDAEDEAFIEALREQIDPRIRDSRAAGIRLPLPELVEAFGLSPLEARLLLVLLAPELEPAFERAYAFAWNDFTQKTASVGFLLGMAVGSFRARCEAALVFSPTEPLRWNGLVELERGASPTERGFLARPVRLAPRVVTWLLGEHTPDEIIQPYLRVVTARAKLSDVVLQEEDRDRVVRALRLARDSGAGRVSMRGGPGCGKKLLLEAILAERGGSFVSLDLESLLAAPGLLEPALRAARREALLRQAALYVDCSGVENRSDVTRAQRLVVERILRDFPRLLIFGGTFLSPFYGGPRGGVVDIRVALPEADERHVLWKRAFPASVKLAAGCELEELAKQYPLSGGAIIGAVRGAVSRARQRSPQRPVVRRQDLIDSARQQLTGKLATLATRITTSLSWSDLVLPAESMDRLNELTAFARHRKKVFDEWGFGALLPYGRGLSALFHGPPGTGKTMVAGIIAAELGMDLFRVDLSQIVSKYVGETEKNLGRIFDEASQSHSVLLFDEADSLFSKRTEVKSATDRYANLEVNYLLQRMESFDGVTCLTTNFETGIDDAFKRRIRFRIRFPFPKQVDRERLWRKMIPPEVTLGEGVRWDDLAYDFELSGGHIKNAVLRAAFAAAERDDTIRYEDLRAAGSLECKEIGRLVREWPDDEPLEQQP